MPGARTALEGRVITHHRIAVQRGADEENADGRIADMDLEVATSTSSSQAPGRPA